MYTNYLYIARSQSDPNMKKHNVFKVGHSSQPLERIRTLGGSASTETYEPILIVALPSCVKDIHILAHRYIQQYVVHRHEMLQSKYVSVFGKSHANGIKRRREIVMFGPRFPVSRIKDLFRRVVDNIRSQTGKYICKDQECVVMGGGASYCAVCTKFTNSLLNCISYQKGRGALLKRRRVLESVEAQLLSMMTVKNKRKKWQGPSVGSFWIIRPDSDLQQRGYRFMVVRILSNDKRDRTSKIQVWSPSDTGSLVSTLQSRFTRDIESPTCSSEEIEWNRSGWKCVVQMRQFKSFCRIMNVPDVKYTVQQ
jgi:hypothetical protein